MEVMMKIYLSGFLSFAITMFIIRLSPPVSKIPTFILFIVLLWWLIGLVAMVVGLFGLIWQ